MLRKTLAVLGLATLLVVPQVSFAQSRTAPVEAQAPSSKASIEILVVHATHDDYVDPKLQKVMRNLRSTGFTGFKLLSDDTSRLAPGGDTSVNMVGDRRVKVTLISKTATSAKVRIRLFKSGDKTLDTTMNIPNGKYVMVAGPKHKSGKLVIPVGVTF